MKSVRAIPILTLSLLTTVIIGSSAVFGQMGSSRFSGGQAVMREYAFDFGKVPQGASVSKVFQLINEGRDTLEIIKVKPGCGCTKVPISTNLIAPGDSAEIEIIFSSGRRRGKWAKSTQVFTSDIVRGVSKLKFSAEVYPEGAPTTPLYIEPNTVETMSDLTDSTYTVSFKNITMEPMSMSLAYTDDDFLEVKVPSGKIGPGERKTIEVTIKDDRPSRSFAKSFTIQMDDAKSSRITVPVRVYNMSMATPDDR